MQTLRLLLVTTILGLLVVYLADTVLQKISAPPAALEYTSGEEPVFDAMLASPNDPAFSVTSQAERTEIVQQALFEPTRSPPQDRPPPQEVEIKANVVDQPTQLEAKLLGTILQEPKSIAILRLEDKSVVTISVGTKLQGWTLDEIMPDGARFARDDEEMLLQLILE